MFHRFKTEAQSWKLTRTFTRTQKISEIRLRKTRRFTNRVIQFFRSRVTINSKLVFMCKWRCVKIGSYESPKNRKPLSCFTHEEQRTLLATRGLSRVNALVHSLAPTCFLKHSDRAFYKLCHSLIDIFPGNIYCLFALLVESERYG